jgi:4-amino-4-deoxy-L-arabinose transferase-like glycosyltransferase
MQRALWGWLKKIKAHSLIITIVILLLVMCLFLYHLSSLPKGLSMEESAYRSSSVALHQIYNNPINAPHKLLVWALGKAGLRGHESLRIVSVFFGAVLAAAFYLLSRGWFGKTIGILSTLIFSLTPLFMISARHGTADILLFSPIILMASYSWFVRANNNRSLAWLWLLIIVATSLYAPGMIWWLIGGAIICRQKLMTAIAELHNWLVVMGSIVFVVLILPAIIAVIGDWRLLKEFGLIPAQIAPVMDILKHVVWMLAALFGRPLEIKPWL